MPSTAANRPFATCQSGLVLLAHHICAACRWPQPGRLGRLSAEAQPRALSIPSGPSPAMQCSTVTGCQQLLPAVSHPGTAHTQSTTRGAQHHNTHMRSPSADRPASQNSMFFFQFQNSASPLYTTSSCGRQRELQGASASASCRKSTPPHQEEPTCRPYETLTYTASVLGHS